MVAAAIPIGIAAGEILAALALAAGIAIAGLGSSTFKAGLNKKF